MPRGRSLSQLVETAHAITDNRVHKVRELQKAANELLGNSQLLRELEPDKRIALLKQLFPYLTTFQRGLLGVIKRADNTPAQTLSKQFGTCVAQRVTAIDSSAKAQKEHAFLTWLLTQPPKSTDAIRTVLNATQLKEMIEVVRTQAPSLARRYGTRLLSWDNAAVNRSPR